MMILLWFIGAIFICGSHVIYLRSWRRESRERLAQLCAYDAAAQRRHDEYIVALTGYRRSELGWVVKRGQA